jgi:hypothetical protein
MPWKWPALWNSPGNTRSGEIIAVGNEAMVHWAWDYYVEPAIILKWVDYCKS